MPGFLEIHRHNITNSLAPPNFIFAELNIFISTEVLLWRQNETGPVINPRRSSLNFENLVPKFSRAEVLSPPL